MTAFWVGMRVRIKWSTLWPELAGQQGVIVGLPNPKSKIITGKPEWHVKPDSWDSLAGPCEEASNGIAYFCPNSNQLEPLTDSNELVTWESMRDLWVPEHMRTNA